MRISNIAQSLYLAATENPNKLPEIARNFGCYLKKMGLKRKLPLILEKLDKVASEKGNFMELKITSAKPLKEKDQEKIKKNFYPKKVIIKENIDQNLISGLVVQINETTFNSSVKGNLNRLKEALWQT